MKASTDGEIVLVDVKKIACMLNNKCWCEEGVEPLVLPHRNLNPAASTVPPLSRLEARSFDL